MTRIIIAKWQTRGGKHWIELYRHSDGAYTYSGNDCGGCIGVLMDDVSAIVRIEKTVLPYAAPCDSKLGLQRVT